MKFREKVENQQGYAMLITLLTLVFITVLGLTLMMMAMNTSKITKSERASQSSYYIAEAGLVEKRAQINEIARQVYTTLKAEYDLLESPSDKQKFKLEEKFTSEVQKRIQTNLTMSESQTYSEQNAQSPSSTVTVTPDSTKPLKYLITSLGEVPSDDGSVKEKTVSQNIEVKMLVPNSIDKIEIPGNNTVQKLKACYAIKTSNSVTLNGGTINGDIYTEGRFDIVSGWPTINDSIVAKGNATISGGVFKKDIVSYNDTIINAWISVGGNVIAKNNIRVNGGINNLGGNYIYGKALTGNINKPRPPQENMDSFLMNYSSVVKDECIENIPALPDESMAFPTTNAISLPNQTLRNKRGNTHDVIKDKILNINNYLIVEDVLDDDKMSGEMVPYKLVLNEDVYFEKINIDKNYTLKIDLKNQHRKIYVDDFNNVQGHIELINAGSLEIIVQKSFNSKGRINVGSGAETSDLTIRYAGSGGVTLTGESDINGSFYIKRAPTLNISNIGNSGIRGDLIIFGETAVKFGGGASVSENLILAPNSSVTLEGGAAVKGNVIAKTFNINQNGSVTPPTNNSGEWEIPGSQPEIIEVPVYKEGNNFLKTGSIKQK